MPPEQAKLTRGRGRGSKSARGGGRGGGGRGSKTARGSGRGSKPARGGGGGSQSDMGGTVPTHVRPDSRAAAPTAEAAQLALPAAPPSEPAQAPPSAPSQVVVKKEPREKPKEGEMQRMLASLKRSKSASGVQLLQEYEACQGHLAKRAFYYDRFLALQKEVAKVDARKMHGSSTETSENTKDFGWVEAKFIASQRASRITRKIPRKLLS